MNKHLSSISHFVLKRSRAATALVAVLLTLALSLSATALVSYLTRGVVSSRDLAQTVVVTLLVSTPMAVFLVNLISQLAWARKSFKAKVGELERATAALTTARDEAHAASQAKSHFLANMSHELRTPLNAIIGFSELIRDESFGPVGKACYREYALDIHSSGTHLLNIINDILDLTKIEAGKFDLALEPIELGGLIDTAVRFVEPKAATGEIALKVAVAPGMAPVQADRRALKQILLNLLSNAVKFTPRGGRIEVRATVEPRGEVVIAVADTGIGIAPADMARVMTPFGQVETAYSRSTQGTGLGLPLTKHLVEMHGGHLELVSASGKGTTAIVRLPAGRAVESIADPLAAHAAE
ncbi:MAG TPA: HAMP domain-containing sensor histidine kinase [Candidatus Cybelea sp.]|nr:HAMP domain-containing sensor histidine kinase [Candidatus Cybelea sp.]